MDKGAVLQIAADKIKIHRIENVAGKHSWTAGISNSPGLYWIYSDIQTSDLLNIQIRSTYKYRRDGVTGVPEVKNEPIPADWPQKAKRVGAYCLRTRAMTSSSVESFLIHQPADGGLYCVYNGYVSGNKLKQRANEHLGPSDPGTGCMHLIDKFCYENRLVDKFQWEFHFCEFKDIPGADLSTDQAGRKRFLTVWEQGVRSNGRWPILCSQ